MTASRFFIPESTPPAVIENIMASHPGDIILVPDDFHIIEVDSDTGKVKEHGFTFELLEDGKLRRVDG